MSTATVDASCMLYKPWAEIQWSSGLGEGRSVVRSQLPLTPLELEREKERRRGAEWEGQSGTGRMGQAKWERQHGK